MALNPRIWETEEFRFPQHLIWKRQWEINLPPNPYSSHIRPELWMGQRHVARRGVTPVEVGRVPARAEVMGEMSPSFLWGW